MRKSIMYIGMDVHKESIEIAIAEEGNQEVRRYGRIDGKAESLAGVLRKLVASGKELRFVYEAGPCGYYLYRQLKEKGLACKRLVRHDSGKPAFCRETTSISAAKRRRSAISFM